MLTEDKHNSRTDNLHGDAIAQTELADYRNLAFDSQLTYQFTLTTLMS